MRTITLGVVLMLITGLLCVAPASASMMDGLMDFLFGEPRQEEPAGNDVTTKSLTEPELRDALKANAQALSTLGLGPFGDKRLDAVAKDILSIPADYREGIDLTQKLLYEVGCGDYNYDTGKWKPTSHSVYAFDTEVFDLNHMYTNFLLGVSAINQGEFTIGDVEEVLNESAWLSGAGNQVIRLSYDGHPYSYTAKVDNDWLDMGVVAFMNDVFEAEGNPKRLYCFGDQAQVMFYNTPEWAAQFTKETGIELSDAPFGF